MRKPWFDSRTGHVLFDEHIFEMPSFQAIRTESLVTEEDIEQQANRVNGLLRRLEAELTPDTRVLAGEVLCELAVLYALHTRSSQQYPLRS